MYLSKNHTDRSRLERFIREAAAAKEWDKIQRTLEQLCHDYAYAVHLPHARNGGLIGLAAASIALGSVSLESRAPVCFHPLTHRLPGRGCTLFASDSATGIGLLHGSGCACALLRL